VDTASAVAAACAWFCHGRYTRRSTVSVAGAAERSAFAFAQAGWLPGRAFLPGDATAGDAATAAKRRAAPVVTAAALRVLVVVRMDVLSPMRWMRW
jgi:hypothetical protein